MSASGKRLSLSKGKLYLAIAGPSGGGKSTLCSMLLKAYSNLVLSISSTTRARRANEKDGEHYFFVSKDDFKKMIADEKMVEWAEVHDNFYGTSRSYLEKANAEEKIVLLDVDIQGVFSFERLFPDNTVSVFLHPPSMEELEARLRKRGTDSEEIILKRLENARFEINQGKKFTHQVINQDLDETFAQISKIVESEFGVADGESS